MQEPSWDGNNPWASQRNSKTLTDPSMATSSCYDPDELGPSTRIHFIITISLTAINKYRAIFCSY